MKRAFLGFALLAASPAFAQSGASSATPAEDSPYDKAVARYLQREAPKIVGGLPARLGAHPWQVSLAVSWIANPLDAHFCGGSVLNDRWIVTAAHCVPRRQPADLHVIAGTNYLAPGSYRANVARIVSHKLYSAKGNEHDIALLELRDPLPKAATIQPIAMTDAKVDGALTRDVTLTVTGWGATAQGGGVVRELQEVGVSFVPLARCKDPLSYGERVTENMLCAGQAEGKKDSCQGDSGGPLVFHDQKSRPVQVGVVSWGDGCAQAAKFGVYTRVARYADWIARCTADPQTCQ